MMNRQRLFGDSGLSYAWVTSAVPIGCLMLAVALLHNMAGAWRRRGEGELVYTRADQPAPVVE